MDIQAINQYLTEQNQPSYRLKQIKDAFFKESLSGFDNISNLPKDLKTGLASKFPWLLVKPIRTVGSLEKGVIKALLELSDGLAIETVLMVYRDWISVCLSVSVGCPLGCSFCATGKMGFKRNLSSSEIVDQIAFWNQSLTQSLNHYKYPHPYPNPSKVSRIVFMGMGEPFLNWDQCQEAIKTINDPNSFNIGQRHITVSTAGIISGIKDFTNLNTQINLAISLHSPFQDKRETIMPIAQKYPLADLMLAANDYVQKTNRKLFFEYVLIDGFNDRPEDAAEIRKIFTEPLFHLNIINLNPTDAEFNPATQKRITVFTNLLDQERIPYTVRRSIGTEIQAACGQLATKG